MSLCAFTQASFAWAAPAPKGPTEADIAAYLADKPAATQPYFRSAIVEGERNRVLNLERAGLAAMEIGNDAVAIQAFDQALQRIESVYADNANATKARSKFVKEAIKDFKGEPYERVMAYYYRGILYLRAGDYENARATFRGGQLQDAFAEDQRYTSDYASLEMLSGWASHCLGDEGQAADSYAEARKFQAGMELPGKDDRTLVLIDLGVGPQKYSDGKYNENLRFRGVEYPEANVLIMSPEAERHLVSLAQSATQASASAATAQAAAAEAEANAVAQQKAADLAAEAAAASLVAPSPAAEAAPAAPPPATPAGARAAAARAKAAAQQAEADRLAVEKAAFAAALASDRAQAAAAEAAAAARAAQADAQDKAVKARNAQAMLSRYGLSLANYSAVEDAPDAKLLLAATADNLLYQATTRGGRQIDAVLAGKAAFKEGATQFSNGMSQASMIASQSASNMAMQAQQLASQGYNVDMSGATNMAYAGMAFAAIGLIGSMAANAAKPQADIRYWDSLPGEIRYRTFAGGPGTYKAIFQDAAGARLGGADFKVTSDAQNKCSVGWVRSRSALGVPASAPNSEDVKK